MVRFRFALVAMALCVTMLATHGCGLESPQFVDEGTRYTAETAFALLEQSDPPSRLKGLAPDKGRSARQQALASLRGEGEAASEAATVITRTFPGQSAAVPYRVERVAFNGERGLMIFETSGRTGEKALSDRRLWIIDDAGDVLLFGSR